MAWYLHEGAVHETIPGVKLPEGAVMVPRLPGPGEWWDAEAKAWAVDTDVAADFHVPAAHIAAAHALKMIEATLVLSGIKLTHGLLVEEAAATGTPLAELARNVAEKSSAFRALEIERRTAKFAGRATAQTRPAK